MIYYVEEKIVKSLMNDSSLMEKIIIDVIDGYAKCNNYQKLNYEIPIIKFVDVLDDSYVGEYKINTNEIYLQQGIIVLDMFLEYLIKYSIVAAQNIYKENIHDVSLHDTKSENSKSLNTYDVNLFNVFIKDEIVIQFLAPKYECLYEITKENCSLLNNSTSLYEDVSPLINYINKIDILKTNYNLTSSHSDEEVYRMIKIYSEAIVMVSQFSYNLKIIQDNEDYLINFLNNK